MRSCHLRERVCIASRSVASLKALLWFCENLKAVMGTCYNTGQSSDVDKMKKWVVYSLVRIPMVIVDFDAGGRRIAIWAIPRLRCLYYNAGLDKGSFIVGGFILPTGSPRPKPLLSRKQDRINSPANININNDKGCHPSLDDQSSSILAGVRKTLDVIASSNHPITISARLWRGDGGKGGTEEG
ncbi:uncharacterized protein EI90DRAFT_2540672 [Cantharellus anzutake]|uniref:uncharacterized protein n=1 Tax=Cantharellus anzutake TaxID=1750568 RepID=UPI0019040EC5|nr:uncharacterized protein EI90DRAFT_2540672 [Cantharellus anzutake]KAF8338098.1 hypothetical protein EI90DRAFT_2540672 [Cantharellus anzutake]